MTRADTPKRPVGRPPHHHKDNSMTRNYEIENVIGRLVSTRAQRPRARSEERRVAPHCCICGRECRGDPNHVWCTDPSCCNPAGYHCPTVDNIDDCPEAGRIGAAA